jgi:acyl-CoA synthetase (AMP-forming)/AMP-acid ligase II
VGSVGKPMPPMEVHSVGPDGERLPADRVGEIHIRMPGREREYYNDPEATAATWSDGWLHTGDLGYLDADGYLYIVGRAKEVIIRGGNNVYATDVEAVLTEHPAVQDAAVIGIPHDVLGEDIAAFAVLRPGTTLTADDLQTFCRERLADYKVPRRITFLPELPRNATGKVLKHELGST